MKKVFLLFFIFQIFCFANEESEVFELESVSDLEKGFVPFKDIVIIQKKFLPRSQRMEISPGISLSLSNPYFNSMGAFLKLSYSHVETFSFDLMAQYLFKNPSSISEELIAKRINAHFPGVRSILGASVRWNPVYGKLSLFQNKLIYFDMYLAAGMSHVTLTSKKDVDTQVVKRTIYPFHLRLGQSYAINKSFAVFWDLAFHIGHFHDDSGYDNRWYLNLGFSFFYPEASYR